MYLRFFFNYTMIDSFSGFDVVIFAKKKAFLASSLVVSVLYVMVIAPMSKMSFNHGL